MTNKELDIYQRLATLETRRESDKEQLLEKITDLEGEVADLKKFKSYFTGLAIKWGVGFAGLWTLIAIIGGNMGDLKQVVISWLIKSK